MRLKPLIRGLCTFVPGLSRLLPARGTGGTTNALYAYGVWLKHLTLLHAHGMPAIPRVLAELGPGDSLGIGLSAMLSGVDQYYALDVVRHSNPERNLAIFEELVVLFRDRAPRPRKGWPDFDSHLDARHFPSHILTDEVLARSLAPERLDRIRNAIRRPDQSNEDISVRYLVPWSSRDVIEPGTVDVLLSHSVLEHVVDLPPTYEAMHTWLKPGGIMSHQIDFESHGLSEEWNGYRGYPEWAWKLILGRRPFLINREPYSVHWALIGEHGFEVLANLKAYRTDGLRRSRLASRWRGISDDDLSCSGAFVQGRRA